MQAKLVILGNHLKLGHTLSLQNRPTEVIQNKSIYEGGGAGYILDAPVRRIRQRRDATGAPTREPELRATRVAL